MDNRIAGSRVALPKLPLWDVIKLSYSTYFENFIDVLRIVWVWALLVIPVTAVASWLQASWMGQMMTQMTHLHLQPGERVRPPAPPIELTVASNASTLLLLFCGVGIAVAWHRRLILGERPGISGSNIATRSFWSYILAGIIILSVSALPAILVVVSGTYLLGFDGNAPSAKGFVLLPLLVVLYCVVAGALLRLSLLLPAHAVGDVDLKLKEAWRATRGNTWRLFWGLSACSGPPMLLAQIVFWVFVGFPTPLRFANSAFATEFAAFGTLSMAYYLLMLPISIGFLSHAYRYFFGGTRIP